MSFMPTAFSNGTNCYLSKMEIYKYHYGSCLWHFFQCCKHGYAPRTDIVNQGIYPWGMNLAIFYISTDKKWLPFFTKAIFKK